MLIWDDRKRPAAAAAAVVAVESQPKKIDYSHCPLKKRPVNYDFVKYEYIKEEQMDYGKYADFLQKLLLLFPRESERSVAFTYRFCGTPFSDPYLTTVKTAAHSYAYMYVNVLFLKNH